MDANNRRRIKFKKLNFHFGISRLYKSRLISTMKQKLPEIQSIFFLGTTGQWKPGYFEK